MALASLGGRVFPGAAPVCAFRTCLDNGGAPAQAFEQGEVDLGCASLVAEAWRKQQTVYLQADAYDGEQDRKHKPWMGLTGSRAWVVVGAGATPDAQPGDKIHPMTNDLADVHFIAMIWVVDQNDRIVALRQLSPDEAQPASLVFDVPSGTTLLTAYECGALGALCPGHWTSHVGFEVESGRPSPSVTGVRGHCAGRDSHRKPIRFKRLHPENGLLRPARPFCDERDCGLYTLCVG